MTAGEIRIERIEDPRGTVVARKGGGKSGGGGITTPNKPNIMPNTLRSRATARITELLSEGPVWGLAPVGNASTMWQAVYLDGTPVADAGGSFNFGLMDGHFRYGYPSQASIPGYSQTESEVVVGVKCEPFTPVVRAVNAPVSAIRYKVRIPALYDQEGDGDVVNASVAYAFDVQIDGGPWTNVVTERIHGKTTSPYERAVHAYITNGEDATTINCRIERIEGGPAPNIQNDIYFQGFTEILYDHMSYDNSCVVASTIRADEFQSVPSRAYLLKGLMIQVPENYTTDTHAYSGDWSGVFKVDWTDNPAWILYGLLTNERWGLGKYIEAGTVDKWSFFEAAVWNDYWMWNFGEFRFTCNCVINTRQDAYAMLQAVASNMLAQLYYSNGTIFLVQDRPQTSPVRIFGPADVENGLFDYTSADVRSRYNAVPVQWNDPDDEYRPAVELVQDNHLVAIEGYRPAQPQALFGCTSRGQAIRWGRWFIYTNHYETEVVTFKTGIENADLKPGDYILINDPSRAEARLSGRILDGSVVGELTLDKLDPFMIAQPTASSLYVTIGSAAEAENPTILSLGIVSVIDAAAGRIAVSGMASPIRNGSMWLARSGQVEPTPWRVAAISDREGMYEITATEYHNEKWQYVENNVLLPPPVFSLAPTGPLLPPSNMSFSEFIYRDASGQVQFGIVLSWSASPDARIQSYQVELSGPGGDYRRFSDLGGVAQEVLAMRQGEWTAALLGFDNIGRRTQVVSLTFIPVGLTAVPQPPSALYLSPQGALTTVTWVPTGEVDVAYYWLKWSPQTDGSATWSHATTSIARVPYNATELTTPTRSGTYMLKAIDALGQESELWAEAIQLIQRTERVHVIDLPQEPDWLGDRGAYWHQNVDQLWVPPPDAPETIPAGVFPGDRAVALNKTPTRVAIYTFPASVDLGMVTAGVSTVSLVEAFGAFFGTVMADWTTLAEVDPLASGSGNTMSSWRPLAAANPLALGGSNEFDAHIEMRVSQDGVTFEDWSPLKSTIITGREFEFRLIGVVYDLLTTLRCVSASVTLEVPLRNVQGEDVALNVTTGALSVVYPIPFMATPTVQITARQSLSAGGNIVITASDETGFSVQHKNSAGANVGGGSIDYFVQGYGGHAG